MVKKTLNIMIIALLALNLMGAWAFASAMDCGMECCQPGAWAGTLSLEAPSCCQMSDVTCGFETGKYDELFDAVICCFHSTHSHQVTSGGIYLASAGLSPPRFLAHAPAHRNTGPPRIAPFYLSNSTFLC